MKQETLTAAAMQASDPQHQRDLVDLAVMLTHIQSAMFCPNPACKRVLDIGRAISVFPKGSGIPSSTPGVFCGAGCAVDAMRRLTAKFLEDFVVYRTLTPSCFKPSFPHVRLHPEPVLDMGAEYGRVGAERAR